MVHHYEDPDLFARHHGGSDADSGNEGGGQGGDHGGHDHGGSGSGGSGSKFI